MQKTPSPVLSNLIHIRLHPPSLNVSVSPEVFDAVITEVSLDEAGEAGGEGDIAAENIDWDINFESSDIDWDIGTVETEDNGNGLGPYEIVSASDALPNSPHKDGVETQGISWDINVENPMVGGAEETVLVSSPLESGSTYHHSKAEATGSGQERSQLMETEYRNKILDDLFEVLILEL